MILIRKREKVVLSTFFPMPIGNIYLLVNYQESELLERDIYDILFIYLMTQRSPGFEPVISRLRPDGMLFAIPSALSLDPPHLGFFLDISQIKK